ncbi:MAG: thiamine phosphate synthase [Stackebrandtia sp.]
MVDSAPVTIPIGRLHVVTDTRDGRDPVAVAEAALAAGAPVLQVRVDDRYSDREAYDLAVHLAAKCAEHGAVCLINDRLHVALAVGAHGGHVGAADLPVHAARTVLGANAIVGGTCRDPESARALRRAGASYLGVGPTFSTSTKTGLPDPLGPRRVGEIAAAVDIPVVAVGGVTADAVPGLLAAGVHGVAVVSAVSDAPDPYKATRELLDAIASAGVAPQ